MKLALTALATAAMLATATPQAVKRFVFDARGEFTISLKPGTGPAPGTGRYLMSKQYHGALEGTSQGEMLSAGDPATGSAGYVAIEAFTGTLEGRRGSFALQHSGTMDAGKLTLTITVVPGSGSEALKGLVGNFTIKEAGGKHSYEFHGSLPG